MVIKKIKNKVNDKLVNTKHHYEKLSQSKYNSPLYTRFLIFLVLLLWGLFLVKISPSASSLKKELSVVILNHNLSLDIHKSYGLYNDLILRDLYTGLVEVDSNNKIVPSIATRWIVNNDATVYKFYLKQANWSNGEKIVAEDFVYAYKKALLNHSLPSNAYLLFNIKGAYQYYNGKTDDNILGIKAIDENILEIKLVNSDDKFLYKLDNPIFYPLPSKTDGNQANEWLLSGNLIVNGAYKITDVQPNAYIKLTQNPYHAHHKNSYTRVNYFFFNDIKKALRQYDDNEISIILNMPSILYSQFNDNYANNIQVLNNQSTQYLGINKNNSNTILLDKDLRKYVGLSFLKSMKRIQSKYSFTTIYSIDKFIYNLADDGFLVSIEENLRALILSKGYSQNNPIKLNVLYISNILNDGIFNALKQELLAYNIQLILQPENYNSYMNKIFQESFDIAWLQSDYNLYNQYNIFLKMLPNNDYNISRYNNKDFALNIKKAFESKDNSLKNLHFTKAQNIVLNDGYYIPLFNNQNFVLFNEIIDRSYITNLYYYRSKYLRIK